MTKCMSRRLALNISSVTFGRAIGVSGSAIRSWERMRQRPKQVYVDAMVRLLDDLEAGRKTLPTINSSKLVKPVNTPETSWRDLAVLLGVMRRLMGIAEDVGRMALGVSVRDFELKEAGLSPMSKEQLARLMLRYAEAISPQSMPLKSEQLSFASQLSTEEK